MNILISEIFLSIQGESINTIDNCPIGIGVPTIFIRTFGCPVQCKFCDSTYAWIGNEKTSMTIDQIINKVEEVGKGKYKTICITGGEPGIHKNINKLIKELKKKNYIISVETSGAINVEMFKDAHSIIMDYKGPSAGHKAMNQMLSSNLNKLFSKDQLKFLIENREDFDYMLNILQTSKILERNDRPVILVSPVFNDKGKNNAAQIIVWMLETQLPLVLNFQIHKVIWGIHERGV